VQEVSLTGGNPGPGTAETGIIKGFQFEKESLRGAMIKRPKGWNVNEGAFPLSPRKAKEAVGTRNCQKVTESGTPVPTENRSKRKMEKKKKVEQNL